MATRGPPGACGEVVGGKKAWVHWGSAFIAVQG